MFTEASNGITSCSRGLLDDVSWNSQWAVWTFSGITSCSREVFDDVSWSSQWIFRWEQWGSESLRALILILFITLNLYPSVSILKRYKTSDNEYSGLHFPKHHVYKKYMLCLWKICYLNVLYTFQIVMVLFLSCSETFVPEVHAVWCLDWSRHIWDNEETVCSVTDFSPLASHGTGGRNSSHSPSSLSPTNYLLWNLSRMSEMEVGILHVGQYHDLAL